MANYRSALGKSIDMAALAAKNEKVRAVGNMKVNARGDTIDSNGKVILPVTKKVAENYSKTVGNRSAQVVSKKIQPSKPQQTNQINKSDVITETLTPDEVELEANFDDDIAVEQIRSKDKK